MYFEYEVIFRYEITFLFDFLVDLPLRIILSHQRGLDMIIVLQEIFFMTFLRSTFNREADLEA